MFLRIAAALAVPDTPSARYNATLDCTTFNRRPVPHGSSNTCDDYGTPKAWSVVTERPLPAYYADMKLGIFIHWGAYSVPSYGTEWFWHNYVCGGNASKVKTFADKNFPQVCTRLPPPPASAPPT